MNKKTNVSFDKLKENRIYIHSQLGIVRLIDKNNLCVEDNKKSFHLIKLTNLFNF